MFHTPAPSRSRRARNRRLHTVAAALVAALALAATPAATAVPMTASSSASAPSSGTTTPLSWAPPQLESPTAVQVSLTKRNLKLDAGKDYVVEMPSTPLVGINGLQIHGGRNVVLVGGRIEIPPEALELNANAGRGLYLKGQTGTVHVEGLHITGAGLKEGINLDESLGAVVQLQNIRVDLVHGSLSGHHADVLQTWGGPRQLLVDGLTGYSQYQGMFLLPTQYGAAEPELFDLRRIDLHGTPTSAYMMWRDSLPWPLTVRDFHVAPKNPLSRDSFLWPKGTGAGTSAWPAVLVGTPPGGEFVPASAVGTGYRSPGYTLSSDVSEDLAGAVLEPVAPARPAPPLGALDSVTAVPGGLRVTGWASDRDTDDPVSVELSVDGVVHQVTADRPRPDVPLLHDDLGDATGYDAVIPLPTGRHTVCATAVNVGSGADTALGCVSATVADTTAPEITAPTLTLRSGTVSASGAVPVTARWNAVDDVAVTGTRITAPVTRSYGADVRSADLDVPAGTSRWIMEADDAAGNLGTASADGTVAIVSETTVGRADYWWSTGSKEFLGSSALRTNRSGASMSHTFTGRSVAWVVKTDSVGGLADVYIDGVMETTVSLAAPVTTYRDVVFTRDWDSVGTHTITVVTRGLGGRTTVTSDGFLTTH